MAPMEEDDLPRPMGPPKLEGMAVRELEDYIAGLKAEIKRAEAMIQSKQSVRSGAESLFKKS